MRLGGEEVRISAKEYLRLHPRATKKKFVITKTLFLASDMDRASGIGTYRSSSSSSDRVRTNAMGGVSSPRTRQQGRAAADAAAAAGPDGVSGGTDRAGGESEVRDQDRVCATGTKGCYCDINAGDSSASSDGSMPSGVWSTDEEAEADDTRARVDE